MADRQDVVVTYCHGETVTQQFHHCLFRAFVHDMWGPQRILDFLPQCAGVNISGARNAAVQQFLENDRAEWLWILDSDATFAADMLDRLLASADMDERPIVGALAHQVRTWLNDGEPIIDTLGSPQQQIVPTMYKRERDEWGNWVGYREIESYGRGMVEVDATGTHCLLVHRNVFEKIESAHPHRWFRESVLNENGIMAGEDITFCLAARDAGFPIYVDTRLESGHVKALIMSSLIATPVITPNTKFST